MPVDIVDVVFSGTKSNRLCIFGNMRSVLAVYPLLQRLGTVTGSIRMVENKIQAGLVQRQGSVEARMPISLSLGAAGEPSQSQSTDILFITLILALLLEVVVHGLGCRRHRSRTYEIAPVHYRALLYCSSDTGSSHSFVEPGCTSLWRARCCIQLSAAAPCQCFTPSGTSMMVPGVSGTAGLPHS